jgi:chitin disaccharide deacetylase
MNGPPEIRAGLVSSVRRGRHCSRLDCRSVVLHADDLGLNESVTAGILRGFSHGLLTSTSVLTNAPGCAAAIGQWKELLLRLAHEDLPSLAARRRLADPRTSFDLGIHLNLTQGFPVTGERYPPRLLDGEGRFPGAFGLASRLLRCGVKFRQAIETELRAQIELLLDCGIAPTHLNAHQYADLLPVVASIVSDLLKRYGIYVVRVPWERRLFRSTLWQRFEPAQWCLGQIKRMFAFHQLVDMRRKGIAFPEAFFGTAHAGRIDLALMRTFITSAGPGVTEIGMHPGAPSTPASQAGRHAAWHDPLSSGRAAELSMLTSPELIDLLEAQQIRLTRLSDLASRQPMSAAA